MLRRLPDWDYSQAAMYMITIVLRDRRSRALGNLVDGIDSDGTPVARVNLSSIGEAVADCWEAIPRYYPQVQIVAKQVMPDHFHGILWVKERLNCHLGQVVKGFKIGCNKRAHYPLFAEGFQDTILFRRGQLQNMIDYIHDNPRRLKEKIAHPDLFRVLRSLRVPMGCPVPADTIGRQDVFYGTFSAIGNHELLRQPQKAQIQCSRSLFQYARDAKGRIDKNAAPLVSTEEFGSKCAELLAFARHGAVLVSPCISQGEREIARRAFEAGLKVITLSNKGFSPLYKPGGKLFDQCASGNLLMLAPVAWPYIPGEKKMTRVDACVLNRIAQLISGDGAVEISYKGIIPEKIDAIAKEALQPPVQSCS